MPRHPFEQLSPKKRRLWFIVGCALSVGLMAVLGWLDRSLTTAAAPNGIVSFELAGTLDSARAMIESWPDPSVATLSLGLDYLFLLAYSSTIALGSVAVTGALVTRGWVGVRPLGRAIAWGQWLAAVLDAVENLALLVLVGGGTSEAWPTVALWCALPKFGLVALGLGTMLLGGLACLVRRRP